MLLLTASAEKDPRNNHHHHHHHHGNDNAGKIHLRNTRDQLQLVGPKSLGVALLTAGFVGMVFTIQVRWAGWLGGEVGEASWIDAARVAAVHAPSAWHANIHPAAT